MPKRAEQQALLAARNKAQKQKNEQKKVERSLALPSQAIAGAKAKAVLPSFADSHHLDYARMLAGPKKSNVVQAPCQIPFRSRAMLIPDKLTLKKTATGGGMTQDGKVYAEFYPRVDGAMAFTHGAAVSQTSDVWHGSLSFPVGDAAAGLGGSTFSQSGGKIDRDDGHMLEASSDLDWGSEVAFPISVSGAVTWNLWGELGAAGGGLGTAGGFAGGWLKFRTWDGAAWSAWTNCFSLDIASRSGSVTALAMPATTEALQFGFAYVGHGKMRAGVRIKLDPTVGNIGIRDFEESEDTKDVKTVSSLAGLTGLRVTAFDVLAYTNASDRFNGGTIAGALVDSDWVPGDSTIDSIQALPFDSKTHKLKDGIHAYWRPSSLEELLPVSSKYGGDHEIFEPGKKIVIAAEFDTPDDASLIIEVNYVVEVESTDPTQAGASFAPPADGTTEFLYAISSANPVTENPVHVVLAAGLVSAVKKVGMFALRVGTSAALDKAAEVVSEELDKLAVD